MGCAEAFRGLCRSEEVRPFKMWKYLKFKSWWASGLILLLSILVRSATSEAAGGVGKPEALVKWNLKTVNYGRIKREGGQSKSEQKLSRAIRSNDVAINSTNITWEFIIGPPLIANIEEMKKLVNYPHWRKKLPPKQASARSFLSGGLAKLSESIPGDFGKVLGPGQLQKLMDVPLESKKSVSNLGTMRQKFPSLFDRAMDLAGGSKSGGGKDQEGLERKVTEVKGGTGDGVGNGQASANDDRTTTEKGIFDDLTGGLLGRLFG